MINNYMSYPKPFGIHRPSEQHDQIYVILNGPKGEVCFDLIQASIGYFPGPGNPSHIIFWHQNGVIIADYMILECTGPYKSQRVYRNIAH